jgi:hypothetical protein
MRRYVCCLFCLACIFGAVTFADAALAGLGELRDGSMAAAEGFERYFIPFHGCVSFGVGLLSGLVLDG